jgi:hypothetical protein
LLPSQSRFRDVPQISRDKFDRFPRATTEFTLCVLDSYGLRDHWPARPTLTPQIRFLYIGSRFCSTLPSDPASRRCPCASLSLHLYQVVKRTYTSKLSNMRGVQKLQAAIAGGPQPFGRSYYLQTGPASVKNEPLSENHPLTPIDGAP